jgi:hypothetical protein
LLVDPLTFLSEGYGTNSWGWGCWMRDTGAFIAAYDDTQLQIIRFVRLFVNYTLRIPLDVVEFVRIRAGYVIMREAWRPKDLDSAEILRFAQNDTSDCTTK